ncbi:MAG: mannose-6-phosphate isomerase [Streptosporangiaceae bacterium]|nr:mannose-6-phosphate isomerase [Streptosporangiaceae bacterium]
MQPIVLGPNLPDTFYRGSGRIGHFRGGFRGVAPPGKQSRGGAAMEDKPEDWIASATARFGVSGTDGMTRLPGGTLLADAIAADPVAWLGPSHVARHGADPALLVKLLDAGQRLPLHVHPDRDFAAAHLHSPHGKTEAWIVLEASPDAVVHLGFSRDVDVAELGGWVRSQDVASMLAATNNVPVSAGDTVLCPAGTAHSIGAGLLVIELQEPSDWSVLLEWQDFPVEPDDALLRLPFDQALSCVTRQAYPPARLESLRGEPLGPSDRAAGSLFPSAAEPFFRAERVDGRAGGDLPPSYAVLIVTAGTGELAAGTGSWSPVPVRRGSTVLIPHASGPCVLTGDVQAVRCLPPSCGPASAS